LKNSFASSPQQFPDVSADLWLTGLLLKSKHGPPLPAEQGPASLLNKVVNASAFVEYDLPLSS